MTNPFSSSKTWVNKPGMEGAGRLTDFADSQGLGKAGKSAKHVLGQMDSGDYSGLAGTLLDPVRQTFAKRGQEMNRNALMGGNRFYAGTQPALMRGIENAAQLENNQNEGLAMGQAIPALWGQAGGQFQNALNSQRQAQLGGLSAAANALIASNQRYQQPGWLGELTDAFGSVAGGAAKVAAI